MDTANLNITDKSDALEAVNEASAITKLVQSMVGNIPPKQDFQLSPDQAIGLFYTLGSVVDRLDRVEAWMQSSTCKEAA